MARTISKGDDKVTIIGIASEGKADAALSIGVDHIFNYDNYHEKVKEIAPKGVDLILENDSSDYDIDSKLLRPLGRIVVLGNIYNTTIFNLTRSYNVVGSNKMVNTNKITIFNKLSMWWKSKILLLDIIMGNRSVSGLHLGLLAINERDVVHEALDKIFNMYQDGLIKPTIDSTWKFEDVIEATKLLADRRNVGKVILEID